MFPSVARSAVNYTVIDKAFEGDSSLRKRVYDAISTTPQHVGLFEDIAKYTSDRLGTSSTAETDGAADGGPASKKRRLDNGATGSKSSAGLKTGSSLFYVQDMSFSIPQRKKFTLEMTAADRPSDRYIRARNQASKEVEFGIPMERIQHILCLPVPEKAQRQFNFCILPPYSDGITSPPEGNSDTVLEPMVWTVPDGSAKNAFHGTGTPVVDDSNPEETYQALIQRMFNNNLEHTKVICPDEKQFVSATPEAHRKKEKAYHVKAFRGSKEGYLFFLSTGIFFGFKKPLVFFAFENIESISYTSVLQRTFNLNIATRCASDPEQEQEFELSMIDQADYAGIDAYIKKHGLQDASLAEERRAKKLNINGVKGEVNEGDGSAGVGEEEEESELQKAQRELEDQEDEEEEDYDPGSEGESEGSGSSSEEEEEDDEVEYGDGGKADLVEEELGSEAEEVSEEEL